MAEYIERERLLEIIKSLIMPNPGLRIGKKFLNELLMSYREAVLEKIQEAPAADVAPVRHGRWEWREKWNTSDTNHYAELESCGWYCSHCGIELGDYLTKRTGETIYLDDESRKPFLNRCPNCGWIMDLEDEEHG